MSFNMGSAFKNSIMTMDEMVVPFYTPKTKNSSKQWLPKGSPAPLKGQTASQPKETNAINLLCEGCLLYTSDAADE